MKMVREKYTNNDERKGETEFISGGKSRRRKGE